MWYFFLNQQVGGWKKKTKKISVLSKRKKGYGRLKPR
jgi:hypothetical protein